MTLTVIENGPLVIKREEDEGFIINNDKGENLFLSHLHPETIYICRCGKSNKQPFCDGSHKKMAPPIN